MDAKMKKFCEEKIKKADYHTLIEKGMIKAPITVFMGPNGTGKSISLRIIEENLKKDDVNFFYFSKEREDIVMKNSEFNFDPYKVACAFHSEGERIIDSFLYWLDEKVLRTVVNSKKDSYILIDELDSGLSIDRLMNEVSFIKLISKTEAKRGNNVKFILTCNSYEMAELLKGDSTEFIWVPTKEKIEITTYEEFKKPYTEYRERMKEVNG